MTALVPLAVADLMDELDRARRRMPRGALTNFFRVPLRSTHLPSLVTDHSVFFLDRELSHQRLYFMAADDVALGAALTALPPGPIVADYLARAPETAHAAAAVLGQAGFAEVGTHLRISSQRLPRLARPVPSTAQPGEAEGLYDLLLRCFDARCDHLPEREEFHRWVEGGRVLVSRSDERITGFFIYQLQGRHAHLNYWCNLDRDPAGAVDLLRGFYVEMSRLEVSSAHAWVRAGDTRVAAMHRLFDMQPDGLTNYLFFRDPAAAIGAGTRERLDHGSR